MRTINKTSLLIAVGIILLISIPTVATGNNSGSQLDNINIIDLIRAILLFIASIFEQTAALIRDSTDTVLGLFE